MGVGRDLSYEGATRFYEKQQPAGVTFNGNLIVTEEIASVGCLSEMFGVQSFNGQVQPGLISFTFAPNGSTISLCTIQVQDNGGQNVTQTDGKTPTVFDLDVILANSNGVITTLTPSTGLAVVTGTLLNTYVAAKAMYIQSNGSGQIQVNITDTGRQGFYVMVQGGTQPLPSLSRQMVTGDYG